MLAGTYQWVSSTSYSVATRYNWTTTNSEQHWSGSDTRIAYPNNDTTNKYSVTFLNTTSSRMVTNPSLDANIRIGNDGSNTPIRLDSNYTLSLNGHTLTLEPGTYNTIDNRGQLNLTTAGSSLVMGAGSATVFSLGGGTYTGTLTLGSDTASIVGTAGVDHRFDVKSQQTIKGYGQLGGNTLRFNMSANSTIRAEGGVLTINPTSDKNFATPTDSGLLPFNFSAGTTAVLEAGTGGTLRLYDGRFDGTASTRGTIRTSGNGIVLVENSIVNGSAIAINSGGQLQLKDSALYGYGATNTVNNWLALTNNQGGTITATSGTNEIARSRSADRGIDFKNAGTVDVVNGASLTLRDTSSGGTYSTWANHIDTTGGTMQATDGTLALKMGSRTLDNLYGTIRANGGGTVSISGTVNGGTVEVLDHGTLTLMQDGANAVISNAEVKIDEGGTLLNSSGNNSITDPVSFTMDGDMRVAAGSSLSINRDITTGSAAEVEVDGILILNSGNGTLTLTGGTLNGSGDIQGSVDATGGTVSGELDITGDLEMGANSVLSIGNSPGVMNVDGSFVMDSAAVWNVDIASLLLYDQLIVGGSATVGGTLNVLLDSGFTPALGSEFTILSASSVNGRFDSIIFPQGTWHLIYEGGNVLLATGAEAPEPASMVLLGAGLLIVAAVGRRRARAV